MVRGISADRESGVEPGRCAQDIALVLGAHARLAWRQRAQVGALTHVEALDPPPLILVRPFLCGQQSGMRLGDRLPCILQGCAGAIAGCRARTQTVPGKACLQAGRPTRQTVSRTRQHLPSQIASILAVLQSAHGFSVEGATSTLHHTRGDDSRPESRSQQSAPLRTCPRNRYTSRLKSWRTMLSPKKTRLRLRMHCNTCGTMMTVLQQTQVTG